MNRIILLMLTLISFSLDSSACSALFVKKSQMYLGKNFDWHRGEGVILQNRRGIKKVVYGLDSSYVLGWTSRYGSITFNQVGKEFPYGGINEKGLVIEMLWDKNAHYEESAQPTISELEWIQFNLDNYKTAAEVQYYLDSMNINPVHSKLHYMVADQAGRSFVVDFVNGKSVISNTKEPYQVLTNSNYLNDLQYYEKVKSNIDFTSRKSSDRFAQLTHKAQKGDLYEINDMFAALEQSSEQGEEYKTQWSIVYDLRRLAVYYKSADNPTVKKLYLIDVTFDSKSTNYAIDINNDRVLWSNYSSEQNFDLLAAAMENTDVKLDLNQANQHMMNPTTFQLDNLYRFNNHDLKVTFSVKQKKGLLYYTLMKGEENYKKFRGSISAVTRANQKTVKQIHYSVPKGEYALAAFHDKNSNAKLDKFLGIPSEPTAFSNGKKATFGPPKFEKVKFNLKEELRLPIKIR